MIASESAAMAIATIARRCTATVKSAIAPATADDDEKALNAAVNSATPTGQRRRQNSASDVIAPPMRS